jgi:hypothetical protein
MLVYHPTLQQCDAIIPSATAVRCYHTKLNDGDHPRSSLVHFSDIASTNTTQQNKLDACVHEQQDERATSPQATATLIINARLSSEFQTKMQCESVSLGMARRMLGAVLHCHHLCDVRSTFGSYRPCSVLFEHHEFSRCVVHNLGVLSPHLYHRSAVSDSVPTYSPTELQPHHRPSLL